MKLVLTFIEPNHKSRKITTTLRPEFEHMEIDRIVMAARSLQKMEQIMNEFPCSDLRVRVSIEKG